MTQLPLDLQVGTFSLYWLLVSPVGFPGGASKDPTCQCRWHEMQVWSLGREDPLEKGMKTHSSVLAWRITMEKRNLEGYCLRGHTELDITEAT